MPLFCDVALAVPLDMVFTYAVPPGMEPVVGGRVLVPFRQQRMSGIVVELHDRPPQVKTQQIKKVIEALDLTPVLDEQLLKLGKWIADYYLAPAGEVFRTMLPLSAEFKRSVEYRITDEGRMALHLAGMSGSPARSKRTPEQQLVEFRVLDYLAERESVREERLRGATRVAKALLRPDRLSIVLVGNASAFTSQLRSIGFGTFETVELGDRGADCLRLKAGTLTSLGRGRIGANRAGQRT